MSNDDDLHFSYEIPLTEEQAKAISERGPWALFESVKLPADDPADGDDLAGWHHCRCGEPLPPEKQWCGACFAAGAKQLPMCERCGKARANTSLTFSYRGEDVTTHYYCSPCCDITWEEGVKVVDERAAKLKTIGL